MTEVGPKPGGPSHPTPTGPPRPIRTVEQLPTLGMVIRDAERLGAQMLAVLKRSYDPASGPLEHVEPPGVGYIAIRLLSATADVRSALEMLSQIAALDLPPAGSAVTYPARQDPTVATTGGPPDHRSHTGERRPPGYTAARADAASESGGAATPSTADDHRPVPGEATAAPVAVAEAPGSLAAPGGGGKRPCRVCSVVHDELHDPAGRSR